MRTGHLDVAKALNESDNNVAAGTTPELWDVSRSSRYHTWDLDFECPSYLDNTIQVFFNQIFLFTLMMVMNSCWHLAGGPGANICTHKASSKKRLLKEDLPAWPPSTPSGQRVMSEPPGTPPPERRPHTVGRF